MVYSRSPMRTDLVGMSSCYLDSRLLTVESVIQAVARVMMVVVMVTWRALASKQPKAARRHRDPKHDLLVMMMPMDLGPLDTTHGRKPPTTFLLGPRLVVSDILLPPAWVVGFRTGCIQILAGGGGIRSVVFSCETSGGEGSPWIGRQRARHAGNARHAGADAGEYPAPLGLDCGFTCGTLGLRLCALHGLRER